jgi:hypothetical protein
MKKESQDKAFNRLKKKMGNKLASKPAEEREKYVEGLVDQYLQGRSQNAKGKIIAKFVETYLKTVDSKTRESIDESIGKMFALKDFIRFRRRAVVDFATIYHQGILDGANGIQFDLKKMIDEAAERVEDEST